MPPRRVAIALVVLASVAGAREAVAQLGPGDPYASLRSAPPAALPEPPPIVGAISEADRIRREAIVASAGPVALTIGDLEDRLALATPPERAAFAGLEGRRRLARELLRGALLEHEAEQRGLYDGPAVRRAERAALVAELLEREMALETFASPADVPPPTIPITRRAIVISAPTRAAADAMRDDAPAEDLDAWLRVAATAGAPGGDLGWIAEEPREGEAEIDPRLRAALFGLSTYGEPSPTVRVGEAWAFVIHGGEMNVSGGGDPEDAAVGGAWARREAAIGELRERLRAEHLELRDPDALAGIAFALPEDEPAAPASAALEADEAARVVPAPPPEPIELQPREERRR